MAYDSDSVVTLGTMKKAMTKVKKRNCRGGFSQRSLAAGGC